MFKIASLATNNFSPPVSIEYYFELYIDDDSDISNPDSCRKSFLSY